MKRHGGFFDSLDMFESIIAEPIKAGNRLSVTIIHNLLIPPEHPLSVDGRSFYVDGFTMVFEGVTRSVRKLALYGSGVQREKTIGAKVIDDGPFPEAEGPVRTYFLEGRTVNKTAHIYEWEIDATDFYLREPDGPWQRYGDIDIFRSGETT